MNYVRVPYRGIFPQLHESVFVAQNAALIGDVRIGENSSVWFSVTMRGDVAPIIVGDRTSVQDNSVIHATGGFSATTIGNDCTVGHSVTLHGCVVGDRVLVGMGTIILDNATIGSDTIIGAGSLVVPNAKIPSGVLALGRPAKPVRELTDEDRKRLLESSALYVGYSREYLGK